MIRSALIKSTAAIFIAALGASVATAQNSAVADQLRTQYKLVKLALDANGPTVVDPGTVLVIQKGGILGVAPISVVTCPARYQDGELHAPGGFCSTMVKQSSRFFQNAEKVYPAKIDLNLKKEQISFHVVACDSCNGVDPPTFYKAEVVFQFGKGYLETATPAQVMDTISQVLVADNAAPQQPPAASPAAAPAAPVVEAPPAAIPPPPPPADQPPPTIEIGQTVDQVVAMLGQPMRVAKVGDKQIYFYKDLKVTFNGGKVSDVQ